MRTTKGGAAMRIKLGLSVNLAQSDKWRRIWNEMAKRTINYPFEFLPLETNIEPWFVVDSNQGPFTIFLDMNDVFLSNSKPFIETGPKAGTLQFAFSSAMLICLHKPIKQMTIRRTLRSEGLLPEDIEDELQNKAARRLASMTGKKIPELGKVRFVRETDKSLIIICLNEDVNQKLGNFFVKMEDTGWRFERISLSS